MNFRHRRANRRRPRVRPLAIGKGLRTKVNANIGTSKDQMDPDLEMRKLEVAHSRCEEWLVYGLGGRGNG